MAQSFDSVTLDGGGSVVNFGQTQPTSTKDIPVSVINSNSRTTAIVIIDGQNSVQFSGTYTIFGGLTEYNLIKAKESTIGTLINGTQTITNTVLRSVSLAQSLGGGVYQCQLNFEYLG